ncbi:hypothetical protein D3C73_1218930 [compost metagenome]
MLTVGEELGCVDSTGLTDALGEAAGGVGVPPVWFVVVFVPPSVAVGLGTGTVGLGAVPGDPVAVGPGLAVGLGFGSTELEGVEPVELPLSLGTGELVDVPGLGEEDVAGEFVVPGFVDSFTLEPAGLLVGLGVEEALG